MERREKSRGGEGGRYALLIYDHFCRQVSDGFYQAFTGHSICSVSSRNYSSWFCRQYLDNCVFVEIRLVAKFIIMFCYL